MTRTMRAWLGAVVGAGLAACGGSGGGGGSGTTGQPPPNGFYLIIQGMAFTPLELHVPPGGTVTVSNRDAMAHSITSEAAAGDFTPGEVGGVSFDTGLFTGVKTFVIPASAANGTIIPYYCRSHLGAMATPTGTIKVDDTATPGPPPPGGGGGGGGGGY